MIEFYKRALRDKKVKKLRKFEPGSWINVIDPTEKELEYLIKKFDLDEQNIESGLDENELPRVDFVDNDIYVFLKGVSSQFKKHPDTYLIVIKDKFILTLSEEKPFFLRDIFKNKIEFITTQKLKCLISIFDLINEMFEKSTIEIIKIVNSKKVRGNKLQEKDVANLLQQEDILNNLVSFYYHTNLIYQRIIKKIKFFEADKDIIEDLIVDGEQGYNMCRTSLKTISNLRDYYMISLSNKLNKAITILTIFTILISIPAAISGIYGMNIKLPFQQSPFAFIYIFLLITLIGGIFAIYFKKKKLF